MARRKHHFPVAHDINEDPDLWRIREEFGDRAGFVWLEVLSILDRQQNRWEWTKEAWEGVFRKCRIYPKTGWKLAGKFVENGWLKKFKPVSNDLKIFCGSPNYWKYHTSECSESDFSWADAGLSEPNQTKPSYSKKNKIPESASPTASPDLRKSINRKRKGDFMAGMNLIPELKQAGDEIYYSNRERYRKIAGWIGKGRKEGYPEPLLAECLRRCHAQPIFHQVEDWWGYADNVLEKLYLDSNRDASLAEHEEHKRDFDKVPKGDG